VGGSPSDGAVRYRTLQAPRRTVARRLPSALPAADVLHEGETQIECVSGKGDNEPRLCPRIRHRLAPEPLPRRPGPRRAEVKSWRPEVLDALRQLGFVGTVLVSEPRDWSAKCSYSVVTFWVPRDVQT